VSAYGYSMVEKPDDHCKLLMGGNYWVDLKAGLDWLFVHGSVPIDHPDVYPPPPGERLTRSPSGLEGIPSYKFAYPGPWHILPPEINETLNLIGPAVVMSPPETQLLLAYLRLSIRYGGAILGPITDP
jgi:hypothetical protein